MSHIWGLLFGWEEKVKGKKVKGKIGKGMKVERKVREFLWLFGMSESK